jgi:hypothetical protein
MKRKIIIGISMLALLFTGICFMQRTKNEQKDTRAVAPVNKILKAVKEPEIFKVKNTAEEKAAKIEKSAKQEIKDLETDQIIIPRSVNEVYADYLEGTVVGKKNLGDTEDSSLDRYHYYLYVRTSAGQVKMYRTSESKYNMVNNGDRILYRKTKSDKVLKVEDDKWK